MLRSLGLHICALLSMQPTVVPFIQIDAPAGALCLTPQVVQDVDPVELAKVLAAQLVQVEAKAPEY